MLDLSMVAEFLHGRRSGGDFPRRDVVEGEYGGAAFHVRSESRKNAPDPTTIELRGTGGSGSLEIPLEVVFSRETGSQVHARALGVSVEVRTGDHEFDREVDIVSEDDRFALLFASASRPLRDRILSLLREFPDARFTIGPAGLQVVSYTESEFQFEDPDGWRRLFDALLDLKSIAAGVISELARDPGTQRALLSRFDLFRIRLLRKAGFSVSIALAFAGLSALILSFTVTTLDPSPISGLRGVFVCAGAVLAWAAANVLLLGGRSWSQNDLGWNLTFGTAGLLGVLLFGPAVYNAWVESPHAEEIWDVGVVREYVAPGKRRGSGTPHIVVAIDRPDCTATCDLIPSPLEPPPTVSGGRVKIAVREGPLGMRWIVGLR